MMDTLTVMDGDAERDEIGRRKMVIRACIETIATAILAVYGEGVEEAKENGNIMKGLRAKQDMLKDFETWTAPLVAALEELDKPKLVIIAED